MVDEWGTWYDVEPGTNPGFLYQQNTLRDAILAVRDARVKVLHDEAAGAAARAAAEAKAAAQPPALPPRAAPKEDRVIYPRPAGDN